MLIQTDAITEAFTLMLLMLIQTDAIAEAFKTNANVQLDVLSRLCCLALAWVAASVATFFTNQIPGLFNVKGDDQGSHRNPAGFSFSTIAAVLRAACPGGPAFGELALRLCGFNADSPYSNAAVGNRIKTLHYAEAAENDIKAMASSVYVEDFLLWPFKSYGEFGRSIVGLCTSQLVFDATSKKKIVMVPGDWPAQQFTSNVIRQGFLKSPEFLGRYLHACCLAGKTSPKTGAKAVPPAVELWKKWEARCGASGTEAMSELGHRAIYLQTTIGPLHVMLNSIEDIGKQHRLTFIEPFYRAFTGQSLFSFCLLSSGKS